MAKQYTALRSPLPWIGGKHYLARKIVAAFPPDSAYDTYVEPFCGACHVLLARPVPSPHVEIVNDRDELLVNLLLCLRDQSESLRERLAGLPYSRALYYRYHASLYAPEELAEMDCLEQATRFFYVVRSTVSAIMRKAPKGWNVALRQGQDRVRALHSAIDLLPLVADRLKGLSIENRDFATILARYARPRTFFYCDPPYVATEDYYRDGAGFGRADHERLAAAIAHAARTGAKIALSYYDCPELEEWYPASQWRRLRWDIPKRSQCRKPTQEMGHEVLLCNYAPASGLWG